VLQRIEWAEWKSGARFARPLTGHQDLRLVVLDRNDGGVQPDFDLGPDGHRLLKIKPERLAFGSDRSATNRLDRGHHPALAGENLIGERNDTRIGIGRARGAAQRLRDQPFIATRVDRLMPA